MNLTKSSSIVIALFLVAVYFPLFYHLSSSSIRLWDESLYGINALEMESNGNYIVKYFFDKPDMWNTKPPLMIWIQIIFMKIFGHNELGLRLPSAISGLLTLIVMFRFAQKEFGNILIGVFAGLVLITSAGFVREHVTRTGDHDATVVLFMTIAALYFYKFIIHEQNRRRNLFISVIAFALAALTKGIYPLLFLPGFILFVFYRNQLKTIITSKDFYVALIIFLLPVAGYYLFRESINPGYLKAVWEQELGGRYLTTIEGHRHEFLFYFNNLISHQFVPWIFVFPIAALVIIYKNVFGSRAFTVFVLLTCVSYWLIISSGQTRLDWYTAPMLPLMSLICGVALYYVLKRINDLVELSSNTSRIIFGFVFVLCVFAYPYYNIMNRIIESGIDTDPQLKYGYLIREIEKQNPEIKTFTFYNLNPNERYSYGWNPHLRFYQLVLNRKGFNVQLTDELSTLRNGDRVVLCQDETKNNIKEQYDVISISSFEECELWEIHKKNVDN